MNSALAQLASNFDRRSHDRLVVPGATVSWALKGRESLPHETGPLSDISEGGLAFLTNDPPTAGLEISLVVFLPPKSQTLELLGIVAYSIPRGPGLTYAYRVGVALKPSAHSGDGNAAESLAVIQTLKQTFGKRKGRRPW